MEVLNTFNVLVFSIVVLAYLWLRNKFSYWKNRGVETQPYNYIFGSVKRIILQRESFAIEALQSYRRFKNKGLQHGGWYFLWQPTYFPIDVDIVKNIIQADFQHFVSRGEYYNESGDPLSAHLFSLDGKKWKLLRSKLTPTFTSGKMKLMHNTIVDCTKGLFKALDKESGKSLDIKDFAGRYTTDVIGSCAFGIDCNTLEYPNSEFREKGKAALQRSNLEQIKDFLLFAWPGMMKKLNVAAFSRDVTNFFMSVVRENVEYREENSVSRKDFMQLLIQLKNKGKLVDDERVDAENLTEAQNRITIEDIAAQAFVFFLAGFETSSTTMTFCLYELAKNKEIQDKVRDDVRKVLKKFDGKLTYEAAMEMHYLEQTINETLRKYPPLPVLTRECTKEYKVPGTDLTIEKDIKVMIPIIGIQHDPEYYPDPEKFDPDRFSEENKATRPPFSFIPFGEGPRICIGMRFGINQTKVGLVALLLNYEFSLNEKTKESLVFDPQSFVMSAKDGIYLDFKKLSPEAAPLLTE